MCYVLNLRFYVKNRLKCNPDLVLKARMQNDGEDHIYMPKNLLMTLKGNVSKERPLRWHQLLWPVEVTSILWAFISSSAKCRVIIRIKMGYYFVCKLWIAIQESFFFPLFLFFFSPSSRLSFSLSSLCLIGAPLSITETVSKLAGFSLSITVTVLLEIFWSNLFPYCITWWLRVASGFNPYLTENTFFPSLLLHIGYGMESRWRMTFISLGFEYHWDSGQWGEEGLFRHKI